MESEESLYFNMLQACRGCTARVAWPDGQEEFLSFFSLWCVVRSKEMMSWHLPRELRVEAMMAAR